MGVSGQQVYFITGASGFFGRRVLEALATRYPAATFRALAHRRPIALQLPNTEAIAGSLDGQTDLQHGLRDVDAVIHLAAATHADRPQTYFRVNAAGTERLVAAASQAGAKRFIFASSRAIRPECGDYALSKAKAEQAVRASGIPHVILRFSEIYGPGSTEGLNGLIALVRRFPVVPYASGPITFAPLCLDDAVAAMLQIVERPQIVGRTYTIAGPRAYEFREVIAIIARAFSVRRVAVPMPRRLLAIASRLSRLVGVRVVSYDQLSRMACQKDDNTQDARRDLGFSPLSLEEGLRRLRHSL